MSELVFICYSSADSVIAGKIAEALEEAGIPCWIAPRNVPYGATYADSIVQGIKTCTHFLFVFTKSSNNSQAVINEIELANALKIPTIPFKVENIDYNNSLEYYLRSKQSVTAFNESPENAIDELINQIKSPARLSGIKKYNKDQQIEKRGQDTLSFEKSKKPIKLFFKIVSILLLVICTVLITLLFTKKQNNIEGKENTGVPSAPDSQQSAAEVKSPVNDKIDHSKNDLRKDSLVNEEPPDKKRTPAITNDRYADSSKKKPINLSNPFTSGNVIYPTPRITVVPFGQDNEKKYELLEKDPAKRMAIIRIQQAFNDRGFVTVDFSSSMKMRKSQQIMAGGNQMDDKSELMNSPGADVYVEVDVTYLNKGELNSVSLNMTAHESSTGSSLANITSSSGYLPTNDNGLLATKAIEKVADKFLNTLQVSFIDMIKNGAQAAMTVSLSRESIYKFNSVLIPDSTLSDLIEEWVLKKTFHVGPHAKGSTDLSMTFDEVRIPLRDSVTGKLYSSFRFAQEFTNYIKSLGIKSRREIIGKSIYITIL